MAGSGLGLPLESLLETEVKTEMARRAGASQTGQSAPVVLIAWSFSNLW
jgi:hypothetical protein